jgi:hypothetical protein
MLNYQKCGKEKTKTGTRSLFTLLKHKKEPASRGRLFYKEGCLLILRFYWISARCEVQGNEIHTAMRISYCCFLCRMTKAWHV